MKLGFWNRILGGSLLIVGFREAIMNYANGWVFVGCITAFIMWMECNFQVREKE